MACASNIAGRVHGGNGSNASRSTSKASVSLAREAACFTTSVVVAGCDISGGLSVEFCAEEDPAHGFGRFLLVGMDDDMYALGVAIVKCYPKKKPTLYADASGSKSTEELPLAS